MDEETDSLLVKLDKPSQIKVTSTVTSTTCKLWKSVLLFLFVMSVCVWIMFTLSSPRTSKKWPTTQDTMTKMAKTALYSRDCSLLHQTNATSKWSGFKELVPGTLLYSAFYDDTDSNSPFVRMIAISETFRPPRVFCHSRCDLGKTEESEFHLVNGHKNRRHAAFIVSCSFPRGLGREPGFIDLSVEYDGKKTEIMRYPVISTEDVQDVHNYTICVPPIYGEGPSLTKFVEFMEMNRILGATRFVFYDLELKPAVRNAMKLYQSEGVAILLPWNLLVYVRDFYSIHYHGQLVAVHDCLYRNRGRSKWVGFHDLDEFIVPLVYPTIPLLLNEINVNQSCGFCIQSTVFPLNGEMKVQGTNNSLVTQRRFLRTKLTFTTREKCIVDPRKVFELGVHLIVKSTSQQYEKSSISPKKALVFHYRHCIQFEDLKAACRTLVPETFMKRYKTRIEESVDHVMRRLNT